MVCCGVCLSIYTSHDYEEYSIRSIYTYYLSKQYTGYTSTIQRPIDVVAEIDYMLELCIDMLLESSFSQGCGEFGLCQPNWRTNLFVVRKCVGLGS